MHRNVAQYGLDPASRYPNLNLRAVTPSQVRTPGTARQDFPGQLPHPRSGLPSCGLPSPCPVGESHPGSPSPMDWVGWPGCVWSACLET